MTEQVEIIHNAIIRANKLGAKGIQVTGYVQPVDATSSPEFMLITKIPELTTASETMWYD